MPEHARRASRRSLVAIAFLSLLAVDVVPASGTAALGWEPKPTWGTVAGKKRPGRVVDMLESGPNLYLAGEFTGMVPPRAPDASGRVPRNYLAAINAETGELASWNPAPDGPVLTLAAPADRARLYVGGDFKTIGGQPAGGLAAVHPTTGAIEGSFAPPQFDGPIRALALQAGRLYVGGEFSVVTLADGTAVARSLVAALDPGTGRLLDWTPPANTGGELASPSRPKAGPDKTGPDKEPSRGSVFDLVLSGDGSMLHVAGTFADFGGRAGLLTLDALTGRPTGWQAEAGRPVYGLALSPVDGRRLYVATGGAGGRLMSFEPGGVTTPGWTVKVDGEALAVAVTRSSVYLLGHYDHIVPPASTCEAKCAGGPPRHRLAAFSAANGQLDPWQPNTDAASVACTAFVGPNRLWVGGTFAHVNSQPQPGVAQFQGTP